MEEVVITKPQEVRRRSTKQHYHNVIRVEQNIQDHRVSRIKWVLGEEMRRGCDGDAGSLCLRYSTAENFVYVDGMNQKKTFKSSV